MIKNLINIPVGVPFVLRVGVIGVGLMGQNHVRVYSECANLVGVTDVMEEPGRKVAARFGTHFYKTPEELLDNVDAVSICTPTSEHFAMANLALDKGVGVLLEKPFTGKVADATKLSLRAQKENLVLASGFIERCNPIIDTLKKLISEETYGKPVTISSTRVSSFPVRIRDVGVIMDLGIHDVDILRYIIGGNVKSVYAIGGKFNNQMFEDYSRILLGFDNGVIGSIDVNWLTPMKIRKLSMTCKDAFLQADYMDQTIEVSKTVLGEIDPAYLFSIPIELDVTKFAMKKQEPLKIEIQRFLEAVEKRTKPFVDGFEAVQNLRICEAALTSLKEQRRVDL
ncbi:MAG: putative oxidoreductase [Methanomassiliicoccales archaeon PtaU1.Bin124]|nr:MAG: putative oxidoreductase [Methanomassiliicoccales archaeon PtaU1.Bin124]